jgi:diguanylate cyclase (GGDEF)-like protein
MGGLFSDSDTRAIEADWRGRCRDDELVRRGRQPPEGLAIVVAMSELLGVDEGTEDYGTLFDEAARLAEEEVSAPEALRQLTLLAEGVFEAGGTEYGVRVLRYVGRSSEVVASVYLRRAQTEARRDPLTALPNEAAFTADLAGAIVRTTSEPDTTVIFASLDLNGMKVVNDTYGHQAGNEYLRRFAAVTREFARTHDGRAYRVHGDEFYILFRDPDLAGIQATLEAAQVAPQFPVFSFGLVVCPSEADNHEQLEALADDRLYEMKRQAPKPERDEQARQWLDGEHWDWQTPTEPSKWLDTS